MKTQYNLSSFPKGLKCNNCASLVIGQFSEFNNYFNQKSTICMSCKEQIDWWKVVLKMFNENFLGTDVYSLLGANEIHGRIELKPNETYALKLDELGVPANARVLYINYTPCGNLMPLEMHGNVPHRKIIGNEIFLYPKPIKEGETEKKSEVSIMIVWIESSKNNSSFAAIIDAFEAFSNSKFQEMVLPANVTVESTLMGFLSDYISKIVSKDNTKMFLNDAATYSSQLNIVLPLVANSMSFPNLESHIRGALNKLRKLRNQIAHKGQTENEITKADAAELLCAVLFGFKYVSIIEEKTNTKQNV